MGRPMAANLVKAGHEVNVWNRTPAKDKEVSGAKVCSTPAEAAQGREVVWLCVSDTKAVEQVLFGPNGAAGALEKGAVVADSSTISPSASVRFANTIQGRGGYFLDAPMTGSKVAAEGGSLTFMVGGSPDVIARIQPLFNAMGKTIIHMGENGKGLAAKLAQNLQTAVIFEALAESLTLARKLNVPEEKLFQLIKSSMIRSGVAEYKEPFLLKQDYSPNFPLHLMHKDIRLMLEAGRESGIKLPALERVNEVYEAASRAGYGNLDYAATIMLLEEWAGIPSQRS
jgi:3-hydroxyisobutyrate dehydrogenase